MKNRFSFWLFLFAVTIMVSCNRDDLDGEEYEVNDFIWKGLNSWYFWQKDVANLQDGAFSSSAYKSFIKGKPHDEFFYSLLNQYQQVDRFSWIVDDVDALVASLNGVSKSTGMDFSVYYRYSGSSEVVGLINYVVPNSPAENAGLKRGDVISGVNGSALTIDNYRQLLNDQFQVSIAQHVEVTNAGIVTSGVAKNPTLNVVVLEENPVAFKKIYESNGKKIGYLVYNNFRATYNDELNEAFGYFKQQNVTDLILDLRYNGGGSVNTAVGLGQMITGQFTGRPFVYLDFNQKHPQYNSTENLSSTITKYDWINGQSQATGQQVVNSLNLSKVYVLTSRSTASASELVISSLKPYINVITIGSETYGKFVGSVTLYDSPNQDFLSNSKRNKSHSWAMQPICFAYYNSARDAHPTLGFMPDYSISSSQYFGNLQDFGMVGDAALASAYQLITGQEFLGRSAQFKDIPMKFIGSEKTFKKFGTELFLDPIEK